MRRKAVLAMALLICGSLALAQKPVAKVPAPAVAQPASELADELAQRLSQGLRVKTVVGEAIKVGSVTLIPILMVDVNFAGAGVAGPASAAPGVGGFLMSGEVRPLGFVAVTKTKTRFISAAPAPAQ